MSHKEPKPLSELVHKTGSPVQKLAAEAQRRVSLTDHMRTQLPESLSTGVLACNIRWDGTLVVITSSPEWASRLRFASAQLLTIGRALEPQVQRVRLRVANAIPG